MKSKKCFIICPISNEGSETRKRSDDLLNYIITPACENSGYKPERVDQVYHTDKIDSKIVEYLKNSELVIADVTEENANAFFELGYRMATGRPVIQIAEYGTKLPFDVMTTNTIFYSTTDLAKAEEAKQKLNATIKQISEQEEVLFKMSNIQDESNSNALSVEIMAILFQLQSSVTDIKETLKNNNSETITSIVKAMQNNQPQLSTDAALQMQLINSAFQNPEGMQKILEMVDKIPLKNR